MSEQNAKEQEKDSLTPAQRHQTFLGLFYFLLVLLLIGASVWVFLCSGIAAALIKGNPDDGKVGLRVVNDDRPFVEPRPQIKKVTDQ